MIKIYQLEQYIYNLEIVSREDKHILLNLLWDRNTDAGIYMFSAIQADAASSITKVFDNDIIPYMKLHIGMRFLGFDGILAEAKNKEIFIKIFETLWGYELPLEDNIYIFPANNIEQARLIVQNVISSSGIVNKDKLLKKLKVDFLVRNDSDGVIANLYTNRMDLIEAIPYDEKNLAMNRSVIENLSRLIKDLFPPDSVHILQLDPDSVEISVSNVLKDRSGLIHISFYNNVNFRVDDCVIEYDDYSQKTEEEIKKYLTAAAHNKLVVRILKVWGISYSKRIEIEE